jgi:hypothetical protein
VRQRLTSLWRAPGSPQGNSHQGSECRSNLLIITVGVLKQYRYYSGSFEGPNSVSTKAEPGILGYYGELFWLDFNP